MAYGNITIFLEHGGWHSEVYIYAFCGCSKTPLHGSVTISFIAEVISHVIEHCRTLIHCSVVKEDSRCLWNDKWYCLGLTLKCNKEPTINP